MFRLTGMVCGEGEGRARGRGAAVILCRADISLRNPIRYYSFKYIRQALIAPLLVLEIALHLVVNLREGLKIKKLPNFGHCPKGGGPKLFFEKSLDIYPGGREPFVKHLLKTKVYAID